MPSPTQRPILAGRLLLDGGSRNAGIDAWDAHEKGDVAMPLISANPR